MVRLWVWPFIHAGYKVVVPNVTAPNLDAPIVLEHIAGEPRMFFVHNAFSAAEAEALIEHNKDLVKVSTVGDLEEADADGNWGMIDQGRSSFNAWDDKSPAAKAIIRRPHRRDPPRPLIGPFLDTS